MNYVLVLIAYKVSRERVGTMVVMAVVVMQPNCLPQYLLVHATASVKGNIKEAVIIDVRRKSSSATATTFPTHCNGMRGV